MGPWHRTILGFSGGAVVAAAVSRWGTEADPWIILGACLLFLGTLAHGWHPRWEKWRAQRREPGYVKIVGGFKSAERRVIRYSDGSQDTDVYPTTAIVAAAAFNPSLTSTAAGIVTLPLWDRIKRRLRRLRWA